MNDIRALKAVFIGLLILLAYVIAGHEAWGMDAQKIVEKLATQKGEPWYIQYFMEVVATVGGMGIAIYKSQRIKIQPSFKNPSIRFLWIPGIRIYLIDFIAFLIAFVIIFVGWKLNHPWQESLYIASVFAFGQQIIMRFIFVVAGFFAPKAVETMKEGMWPGGEQTIFTKTAMAFTGVRPEQRATPRNGDTRVWTEEERESARQRSEVDKLG